MVLAVAGYKRPWKSKRVHSYRIAIDSRLSLSEKWECLIHEWAHCIDRGTRWNPSDCHDTRWGQCYAKAFQASHKK